MMRATILEQLASVRHVVQTLTCGLMVAALAACGGGGSGGSAPQSPTIVTAPTDQSAVEGKAASFSVSANGAAPMSYQWSGSADGTTFTDIGGATSTTYSIAAVTLSQNGLRYRVVVTNSVGSAISSAAKLTVTAAPVAPAISVHPSDQTVTAPSNATFNVTATGTAPSYQWQMSPDGTTYAAVAGATDSPTLLLTNSSTAQSGQHFRVVVSNSVGTVTSNAAKLTVNPTPATPVFTTQPLGKTIVSGQAVDFIVAATGIPIPSIQWRINATNLNNGVLATGLCSGATVAGATTNTLSLTGVPLSCDGVTLSAVASNGVAPNAISTDAVLKVTPAPVPPTIVTQPVNQSVLTDATATFTVTANGPGLSYQWKKNAVAIVGATGTSYTTPAATYVDSGAQYTVVISNDDGTVTSTVATLNLARSADQQSYESLILTGGGSYSLGWNLNLSCPQTSGTNYAYSDYSVLPMSPLTNGPQITTQTAAVNLATNLALTSATPVRILRDGIILVVPTLQTATKSTYVGSSVRVDYLAADSTTVAYTQIRSGYSYVSLSGTMAGDTSDFAHWLNSFYTNSAILNPATQYLSGAGYLKFSATNKGDRYNVFDCSGSTTGTAPNPCYTSTTLSAALTTGISSISDGATYHLADGTVSTVGGVPIWVATAARPSKSTMSYTTQYRIYFELNGNVYTGSLTRDGASLGGSYYLSNPSGLTVADQFTFLPFYVRMNKAARDSIAAAVAGRI